MKSDDSLLKFEIPEIIYDINSLSQFGHCAKRLGGERVLLVSDPGNIEAGWVNAAIKFLDKEHLKSIVYDNR